MKGSRVQISVSARKPGGCIAGCDLFFVCGRRRGRDAPHLPPAERRLRDTEAPHTVRAGRPYKRRRAAAGHRKTPQREAGGICCMADNKPTNLQKSGPRVAGIQAVSGEGLPHGGPCRSAGKPAAPAPTGSCRPHVSRNTVCGGSKRMRTLPFIRSAANGRSDRTSEREDFAVLISTRNPAGCKSRKNAKGRSSDSFRFRAFPALRPVAKIAEPLAPRGAGTHSNGYCRRFSLHSLFIPTSARPGGCVAETFATQR